jgi:hypothetical protein
MNCYYTSILSLANLFQTFYHIKYFQLCISIVLIDVLVYDKFSITHGNY